jgi:hypothetical protein
VPPVIDRSQRMPREPLSLPKIQDKGKVIHNLRGTCSRATHTNRGIRYNNNRDTLSLNRCILSTRAVTRPLPNDLASPCSVRPAGIERWRMRDSVKSAGISSKSRRKDVVSRHHACPLHSLTPFKFLSKQYIEQSTTISFFLIRYRNISTPSGHH